MNHALQTLHSQRWDFWQARAAVVLVVALQLLLVNDLAVGPRWLAPALELALLIPLSIATAWTQSKAHAASTDHQWRLLGQQRRAVRILALVLTALITLMNFGALLELLHTIFAGHAGTGRTLLIDALNIWATNVIAFALWFWGIDRGGPAARGFNDRRESDFLFPQQQGNLPPERYAGWTPGFMDYVFVAYSTATAFSPADTFPLTVRAKLLMMLESMVSLLTIALVAARAVGILA